MFRKKRSLGSSYLYNEVLCTIFVFFSNRLSPELTNKVDDKIVPQNEEQKYCKLILESPKFYSNIFCNAELPQS